MSILETRNIIYFYQDGENRRYILNDTSVSFERGQFYSILGQSGSGKTTFLSLISALEKPKGGEILYNGKNIEEIGYESYRRNSIGIVFQSYNLIPYMTAVENVMLSMVITDNQIGGDKKEVAYNLLDYIGIVRTKADRPINKLSGGEQQRVAIARALASDVDLILADEPTGNLDEETEKDIIAIFKRLAHEHNKCVIVVTHSKEIAEQSDQVLYLRKGVLRAYEQ